MGRSKNFNKLESEIGNFISNQNTIDTNKNNDDKGRISLYAPTALCNDISLLARGKNTNVNQLIVSFIEEALKDPANQKLLAAVKELEKLQK